jgi:diguanylate cyclase (GGDEF)-like protein/PAS domain S-box-containing protein
VVSAVSVGGDRRRAPIGGPVRVLLADDTADLRSLVRTVLEAAGGFEVVAEAGDGREALQLAEEYSPDLAVVDVAMPVMGGLQAIPEMRRLVPDMWIAVLTVFSLDDLSGPALAAGADLCLDKTRSPSELVRALAGLVGVAVSDGHPHRAGTETAEAFAAQALRESHAGFKGAFDEAAIGMALTDFDGRPLRVNGALCKLLGTTVEQLMAAPLWQLEDPDLKERRDGDITPWGAGASSSQTERGWVRADGELIWVSIDAATVHDPNGRPLYLFCQIQDVSSRRRLEEALGPSESRYRLLANNATDLIAITDRSLVIRYLSPSCRLILGYEPDDLIGRRISELWHQEDAQQIDAVRAGAPSADDVDKFTVRAQRQDGRWVWLEVSQRIVIDADTGEIAEIQTASRDITERKLLEARLTDLAMHDGLTGLANRVLVMDRLEHALARREGHGQVGVLFVDLDRFKAVNDTLGHSAGDAVLRATADRLQASIRPADTAARLGGDEFVIVCEDLSGEEEAIAVAERIEVALAAPHRLDGRDVIVTASVGVVLAAHGVDGEQLVHRADSAMYDAKQAGRAQHRLWR